LLAAFFNVSSVLDVGCGRGIWLKEWCNLGVSDIVGIDGTYVDEGQLAISPEHFVKSDLSQTFALQRHFDLVQCLEVGEHIPHAHADILVNSLAAHGDIILFSAAVPGQGGEFHVNEQRYEYWRDKFATKDFRSFDWLRPRILRESHIEPWYRYNTLIFARNRALGRAPPDLLATEIPHNQAVPIRAPLSWRIRNLILRQLPNASVHRLAIIKHRLNLVRF
jgi:SAM-dependent methyltransferase